MFRVSSYSHPLENSIRPEMSVEAGDPEPVFVNFEVGGGHGGIPAQTCVEVSVLHIAVRKII